MDYKLLSHVYYEKPEEYESLYQQRFNGEFTTHLPFKIHENDAFFCLSPEILNAQIAIMQKDMQIRSIRANLPVVALQQFAKRSLVDEIVLTNNIEGVHSTRREIDGVLKSLRKGGSRKRFFGLVNKYNMLGNADLPLQTCEDVRKIYDELVLNEVVEDDPSNAPDGYLFRKDMAEVTTATGKIIHHGVYPESKISDNMNAALRVLNDSTIPEIIRISIFHYLFGYIHPFYDGNGRTSRFISSYLLSQSLEELIGYRLSYTIKENIKDYYKAFQFCNDEKSRGDITPFIIMFMTIIQESMENLYTALHKRLNSLHMYKQQIEQLEGFREEEAVSRMAYVLLQARLFSDNGISKQELQQELEISPCTVDKRLQYVERHGYLNKRRIGHTYYYDLAIEKLSSNEH